MTDLLVQRDSPRLLEGKDPSVPAALAVATGFKGRKHQV